MSGLFQDATEPTEPGDPPPPPPDGPGLFGDSLPAPPPVTATATATATATGTAAAYRVLARKYRPTRFDDLIGQESMVRILRNAFALDRVAHAFMLTGVRGVGKTTTARIIARAMNCVGPDGRGGPTADPCGVCANCTAILAERHPDVMEMDAASRTGVDDVREIIEATRFRPLQARAKVFIVDEVHMLSRNAFNALLKTLEEPPPHVKFVFATTEIRKVPVTVLSRCQRFDLRRVGMGELSRHFAAIAAAEQVAIAPAAIDLIARAADGSVRDGLSLLDQAIAQGGGGVDAGAEGGAADGADAAPIDEAAVVGMLGLADRSDTFDLLDAVMAGKSAAALAVTDRAHERGADPGVLLQDLLELLHTVTRLKSIPGLRDGPDLPEAERTRGAALADRLSIPSLGRAWQMLLKGVMEVETAPDRRAAAEMVLIRLCHVADLPTPGDLVRRLAGGAPPAPAAANPSSSAPPWREPPSGGSPTAVSPIGAPGGGRATVNGAPATRAQPAESAAPRALATESPNLCPAAESPLPASFRDVVALTQGREPMLHGHLRHSVHLVRFAPPVIELRAQPEAPRDLAPRLAKLLAEATGTRWTIALSAAAGEPTLAEQGDAADAARRASAADHPLVLAIMAAFPGARIEHVADPRLDAYGLPPGEPDMPAFAPPDAELVDAELVDDELVDPELSAPELADAARDADVPSERAWEPDA